MKEEQVSPDSDELHKAGNLIKSGDRYYLVGQGGNWLRVVSAEMPIRPRKLNKKQRVAQRRQKVKA